MPDYPFTVFSILAAFSCIEPAIVIWKSSSASRPWSGLFLLGWIFVYNIFSFVDSIIWSSDSTDEWLDGRGYCDVSSTLKTIFSIGVLGSIIGISRFLIVAIKDNISQEENVPRNKWRTILEDGFLSLFLPALFIILTFMVESSRYAIVGVLGCRSILDQSWLSIVLYFIWPPIFGLIALAYTGNPLSLQFLIVVFVLHRWRLHRKHLNQNWSLEKPNGPSKLLFQRLVITVIFEVIIFLSYSFYVLINFLITRTDIEFSWDRVHGSDWDIILKVPQQYASWPSWIGIISATFPILFIPLTPRIRLFFQIRKQRKQAKQLPPPMYPPTTCTC